MEYLIMHTEVPVPVRGAEDEEPDATCAIDLFSHLVPKAVLWILQQQSVPTSISPGHNTASGAGLDGPLTSHGSQ